MNQAAQRVIGRAATLLLLLIGLAAFFAFDLHQHLRLATLKDSHATLVQYYRADPLLFIGGFMALHVCALALCIPGAVLTMALAGGAIFGPVLGTGIVLTSLTVGDSLGFLAARLLVGDWVRTRFAKQLQSVEAEVDRNGAFYLLSLRLMAAMPYFIVNLTFGLTRMHLKTFAPVSFLGLAPATALYVNAGTELSRIESAGDVLSTRLIASFALLAILPLIARYALGKRAAASRVAAD
jgi:uncharacterized membrane protein YdjX (TVP38/TMEM64 family)